MTGPPAHLPIEPSLSLEHLSDAKSGNGDFMIRTRWILCSMLLLPQFLLHAAELKIRAVYASNTGVSNLEVTVRNLDALKSLPQILMTDSEGWTPTFKIPAGLYQIRGVGKGFMNSVKEIFVDDSAKQIVLDIRTRANIDGPGIETREDSTVVKQVPGTKRQLNVQLNTSTRPMTPIAHVRVLFRDSEGNGERWLETNSAGEIIVDLPDEPTFLVMPMVVLPINGTIYTFVLLQNCGTSESLGIFPRGATCIPIKNNSAEVEIPITSPISPGQAPSIPKI